MSMVLPLAGWEVAVEASAENRKLASYAGAVAPSIGAGR